jgi:hypothetical protein
MVIPLSRRCCRGSLHPCRGKDWESSCPTTSLSLASGAGSGRITNVRNHPHRTTVYNREFADTVHQRSAASPGCPRSWENCQDYNALKGCGYFSVTGAILRPGASRVRVPCRHLVEDGALMIPAFARTASTIVPVATFGPFTAKCRCTSSQQGGLLSSTGARATGELRRHRSLAAQVATAGDALGGG